MQDSESGHSFGWEMLFEQGCGKIKTRLLGDSYPGLFMDQGWSIKGTGNMFVWPGKERKYEKSPQ